MPLDNFMVKDVTKNNLNHIKQIKFTTIMTSSHDQVIHHGYSS